jgi:hypothetical protein
VRRILALALLVLVYGACGDDTADTSTAASVTTSTTTSTTSTVDARPARCETVVFTPQSEDGAFDIEATGLPCSEAEELVRRAGSRTSSGGPPSVTVDGFRCVLVRTEDDPLPRGFYECTDGPKKVTYVRG